MQSARGRAAYKEVHKLIRQKKKTERRSARVKVRPAVALLISSKPEIRSYGEEGMPCFGNLIKDECPMRRSSSQEAPAIEEEKVNISDRGAKNITPVNHLLKRSLSAHDILQSRSLMDLVEPGEQPIEGSLVEESKEFRYFETPINGQQLEKSTPESK